jgi:hypothetical protein
MTRAPDTQPRTRNWLDLIGVAGAGLILGAFGSRVLAELPFVPWPAYRRWFTLLLALLGCAASVGLRALLARIRRSQHGPAGLPTSAAALPFYLLLLYLVQPTPNLLQAGVLVVGALGLSLLLSNTTPGDSDTQDTRDPPSPDRDQDRDEVGEASETEVQSATVLQSTAVLQSAAIGLLLFIVPLIAYLATMMPGVGTRDGYELQAVSATLGFAHPTGYPLFPILGYLWLALFPDALARPPA